MVQQIITLRDMEKYADQLFTGEREAKKAAPILKAILDARSSRISEIAQHMGGSSAEANTKQIHRWLKDGDPDIALMRLVNLFKAAAERYGRYDRMAPPAPME